MRGARAGRGAGALACAAALACASCGSPADFDASTPAAFAASCLTQARLVSARLGTTPAVGAALIAMFADPPAAPDVDRSFDATLPIPIAGSAISEERAPEAWCASVASAAGDYAGNGGASVARVGISNMASALSAEEGRLKAVRLALLSSTERSLSEAARLRAELNASAPRGSAFRMAPDARRGAGDAARPIPTITMQAANTVGRAIEAFDVRVRLNRADGTALAAGTVHYVPPAPLGPGVESTYAVPLGGVRGLDTTEVAEASGAITVTASLEDLTVGGASMVAQQALDPVDRSRLEAIEAARASVARLRTYLTGLTYRDRRTPG